jgi:hypothetical protein
MVITVITIGVTITDITTTGVTPAGSTGHDSNITTVTTMATAIVMHRSTTTIETSEPEQPPSLPLANQWQKPQAAAS